MSFIAAAAIIGGAAVVGGGISAYGNYQSAKQANKGGYQYDKYGQLNPEQMGVNTALAPVITQNINQPTEQYSGQFTADMSPEEQQALTSQSRLGAMTGEWSQYFQPGQINQEVADTTYKDLSRQFYGNEIDPGVKALTEEQFAGTGGYWGNARAQGVLGAYKNTVTDPYNTWRSNALQNSYANALGYAGTASGINTANAALQKTLRDLKQYGLDQKYTEWVRTRPETLPYINQALSFLGLSTGTAEYKPANPSLTGALLQGVGGGIQQAGNMYGTMMMLNSMQPGTGTGVTGQGNAAQVGALNSSNPGVSSSLNNFNMRSYP